MDLIAPTKASRPLRVLLVEDSVDDEELLRLELVEQGYEPTIRRVETRRELEAALDEASWDVLLCDHSLPSFDAVSALSLVQSRQLDLPFIIVSNVIAESTAVDVMRAGAHDYLFKDGLGRLGAVIDREIKEATVRGEGRRMQQQLLLSDRLVSVGTLAAGVAHEINNPLAYVIGNIDFALDRLATLFPEEGSTLAEVVDALKHAQEGSERIRAATRDLKVFCRTDEESRTAINVSRVMESSIRMAWNEIRHRGNLVRRFAEVPRVAGNENRLGQVFLNLLVNAAQALPDARTPTSAITVSISSADGNVLIEVSDTGCGIPADRLTQVFEPFFTTKAPGVGSGIGLSICRSIVADLGGNIGVESHFGQGTTFSIRLPALDVAASIRPPELDTTAARACRILAIDDEVALCQVIRRLLPEHDVHIETDARRALELLGRDRDFDLIFCDVMMPAMSGIEFFAALTQVAPELVSRTVFLTGGAFNAQARQFLNAKRRRVIEKPFAVKSLRNAVAEVLEAHPSSGTFQTKNVLRAM